MPQHTLIFFRLLFKHLSFSFVKYLRQILLAALWLPLQLAHFIASTVVILQEDVLCALPHFALRCWPLKFSAMSPKQLHLKQRNSIGMYCLTLNFKYPN